jgi:hypothetical protein
VSDKDERSGRAGALPATATDDEDGAAGNPFFERPGGGKEPAGRHSADPAPARAAAKTPPGNGSGGGKTDDEKTAVVRAVSSSSTPGAVRKATASTSTLDAAPPAPPSPAATKTVTAPVAPTTPPPAADKPGSDRADRSDSYGAAGRGAPAKSAGADQQAQPPRDPDTMAIVRNPVRGADTARDAGRSTRARGGAPEQADRDRPERPAPRPDRPSSADSRKSAAAAADPDRTVVEPKPDLAKPARGPAVPAERVPAPSSGSRPVGQQAAPMGATAPVSGAGPDRGRDGQEWARPRDSRGEPTAVAGYAAPTGHQGPPPGRYDRPEPARQDYRDDYREGDDDSGQAGRRAKLRLTRVSPITVTRLAFAFSLCVFLVIMVAVAVLWFVLNSIGVFDSIVNAAGTLTTDETHNVSSWLSFGRAMQISLLIGAINVILITLLSTLGALLYNLCADMIGGIEVTLSDR